MDGARVCKHTSLHNSTPGIYLQLRELVCVFKEVLHMGGPDESLGQVNNSNFFNIAGMMVLEGALDLVKQMPEKYTDQAKV